MVFVNFSSNCKKWSALLQAVDKGGSISSQIEGKQIKVSGALQPLLVKQFNKNITTFLKTLELDLINDVVGNKNTMMLQRNKMEQPSKLEKQRKIKVNSISLK